MSIVNSITGKKLQEANPSYPASSIRDAAIAQCMGDPDWIELINLAVEQMSRAKAKIDRGGVDGLDSNLNLVLRYVKTAIDDIEKTKTLMKNKAFVNKTPERVSGNPADDVAK